MRSVAEGAKVAGARRLLLVELDVLRLVLGLHDLKSMRYIGSPDSERSSSSFLAGRIGMGLLHVIKAIIREEGLVPTA